MLRLFTHCPLFFISFSLIFFALLGCSYFIWSSDMWCLFCFYGTKFTDMLDISLFLNREFKSDICFQSHYPSLTSVSGFKKKIICLNCLDNLYDACCYNVGLVINTCQSNPSPMMKGGSLLLNVESLKWRCHPCPPKPL